MFNRQTPVRLSFQDKYILGFESDAIAFNSHLVLELEEGAEAHLNKLTQAFNKLIELEPFTRIAPDYQTGEFYLQPFENEKTKTQIHKVDLDNLDEYLNKPFDFSSEYAVRMLICNTESSSKLIFSFHHSVYDGHAQINFLKDFFDVYNGESYQARDVRYAYRFRKYFIQTKLPWIFKFLAGLLKQRKKKNSKVKIARLFDKEPENRKVAVKVLELDRSLLDKGSRKLALSSSAYISLVGAKAADALLRERGASEAPIVLYITKSMRFELKCLRAYQNLVGFIWIKVSRDSVKTKDFAKVFRDTYKFRSSDDEVRKTLFLAGLMVKLVGFKKLKTLLARKEQKVHDCTLIVSSGRTPPDVKFPADLKVKSLLARGTMHRSPGIGLMVTSFKNKDFITIEYLEDAFYLSTIERFAELILKEIQES